MTLDLETLHLAKGGHDNPDDGLCLLEAAAFLAGEPHTDHPACVSPVLGVFGRELNDRLDDTKRQQLKPLIPKLPGTAGVGHDDLKPPVDHLQDSAIALFATMISPAGAR